MGDIGDCGEETGAPRLFGEKSSCLAAHLSSLRMVETARYNDFVRRVTSDGEGSVLQGSAAHDPNSRGQNGTGCCASMIVGKDTRNIPISNAISRSYAVTYVECERVSLPGLQHDASFNGSAAHLAGPGAR